MRMRILTPSSHEPEDLLCAVAAARGCADPASVDEFLDPAPPIRGDIARLPDYARARARIVRALEKGERIVLFSDYDCDGITSLVQMHDLLTAAGCKDLRWFVPDRALHDYGLTSAAAEECFRRHEPSLIIALDCGSNAREVITALKARKVDTIVIDHHGIVRPVEAPGSPQGDLFASAAVHPAIGHLNPKDCDPRDPEIRPMADMSAAGLTYLFGRQFASDLDLAPAAGGPPRSGSWSEERACLLAGVGTVVDVMPLREINRSLVKRALRLANDPAMLGLLPGLVALRELAEVRKVDARTLGFVWGPRLNASGRLEEATDPVRLLLSGSVEEARPLARRCHEINAERRELQKEIEEEAMRLAAERLDGGASDRVLLLHHEKWHAGIVGIVASRVKERYTRPVIVCAWHEDGYWKGSGRSPEGFDLGLAVSEAVRSGLLLSGGGHALAAGLKLAPERLEPFRAWLNQRCSLTSEEMGTVHDVLAPFDVIAPKSESEVRRVTADWCSLLSRLEPFGSGNPRPALLLKAARLVWGPQPKTRKGTDEVWGWSAGFSWKGRGHLFADWTEVERAAQEWSAGARYDLLLSPSASDGFDKTTGAPTTWYNLKVIDCERVR